MPDQETLSFVIRHRIKRGEEARYERWLNQIMPLAATYPGHQGVHVIRPTPSNDEFVIVIRFANIAAAKTWVDSPDRKALVAEISDAFVDDEVTELKSGIEFWFTPPSEKRPAAWKQWLITTSVIAPLTMVVPLALRPIFAACPILGMFGISQIITAAVIVGLVTFLIMPRYVRLVRGWLYNG